MLFFFGIDGNNIFSHTEFKILKEDQKQGKN